MKLDTFFEKFDLLADAPGGVAKLRELVLELALSGQLVAQDEQRGAAASLLDGARSERRRLEAEGRIKVRPSGQARAPDRTHPIPPTWEWAQLSDVGRELGQKAPTARFSYVDVGSIDSVNGRVSDSVEVLDPKDAPSRARKLVAPGTVIYSTVRPYLRNIAVIEREFDPEPIASTAFGILHPFAGIHSRYLFHWLRGATFTGYVQEAMTGMAYPAINDEKFYAGPVAVPPSAEQVRIAAKVDELMALCDRLETQQQEREARRVTLAQSALTRFAEAPTPANLNLLFHDSYAIDPTDLRNCILTLAVQGRLVGRLASERPGSGLLEAALGEEDQTGDLPPLPSHWGWAQLGAVTTRMDSGWSPACEPKPAADGQWGVLKTTAVQVLEYQEAQNKALPSSLKARPEHEVMDGDILFTRAGPMNRVGIACVARPSQEKLMISDKIIRIHLIPDIDPDFAALALSAGHSKQFVEGLKSGMAASQVNISQPKLKSVPIPVPPLNEQRRIVTRVAQLMVLLGESEARITRSDVAARRLSDAIVAELTRTPPCEKGRTHVESRPR